MTYCLDEKRCAGKGSGFAGNGPNDALHEAARFLPGQAVGKLWACNNLTANSIGIMRIVASSRALLAAAYVAGAPSVVVFTVRDSSAIDWRLG